MNAIQDMIWFMQIYITKYWSLPGAGVWWQVQNLLLLPGHRLRDDLHCRVFPPPLCRPRQVTSDHTCMMYCLTQYKSVPLLCAVQQKLKKLQLILDLSPDGSSRSLLDRTPGILNPILNIWLELFAGMSGNFYNWFLSFSHFYKLMWKKQNINFEMWDYAVFCLVSTSPLQRMSNTSTIIWETQ